MPRKKSPPRRLRKDKVLNYKKPQKMSTVEFTSLFHQRIRSLATKSNTVQQIREQLLQKFPEHHKQITLNAIRDYLRPIEPLIQQDEELKLEVEDSVFIDEAMILLNSGKETLHIMAAVSSNGVLKLNTSSESRHDALKFIQSVLRQLKNGPCQIMVKSSLRDMDRVQKLFSGRIQVHQLLYYPNYCHVVNPVRKYIAQLAGLITRQEDIGSAAAASPEECKKWVEQYVNAL